MGARDLQEALGLGPAVEIKSIPSPNGGLNKRDSLMNMPETDAVELTNWLTDTGGIRCRKGYSEWAINLPGAAAVGAVFPYFDAATAFPGGAFLVTPTSMPGKLFASIDAGIYDVTNSTNAPPLSQALSGSVNAGWINTTQFRNAAGVTYLLACSETDGYFTYDGAVWVKVTLGGGATQVSVGDPTKFVHPIIFKRRAWFVQINSTVAWYLGLDSIYGAAAAFDFGQQFKHGGHLAYLANWTIDAGQGIDDYLVAVGSNGDVAVYKGTDPTSATTFALVGTWYVGQIPIGRRAFTQYGGDLVIASADGVFPISMVTRGGSDFLVASSKEYSGKIRAAIGQNLRESFTERGWQMMLHPSERVLITAVPNYSTTQSLQYALNTSLNNWSRFGNIPIYSMGFTSGYAFAGTRDGKVLLLLNGFLDNVAYGASTGSLISGLIIPAYNTFETPAQDKQFLLIRPIFLSQQPPQISVDITVNYAAVLPTGSLPVTGTNGGIWAAGLWNVALWGGSQQIFDEWASAGDVGYNGAAIIVTQCGGDTVCPEIQYAFQVGGIAG